MEENAYSCLHAYQPGRAALDRVRSRRSGLAAFQPWSSSLLLDALCELRAKHELAHTSRSIAEIAYTLGYASPQSFQRAFRRWVGSTPGQYRARCRTRRPRSGRPKR
jgi:hypothetical protein